MTDEAIWMSGYKLGRNDRNSGKNRWFDETWDCVFAVGYGKGYDDEDCFLEAEKRITEGSHL